MTKFSNKLKNPGFGLFSQFWGKIKFSSESSVTNNFLRVPSTMPNFRKKLMMQFLENTWTEGRKDSLTLFHRTLPVTTGGPKTDKHEDIQMNTKAKENILKTNTVSCQCCSPR